MSLVCGRYLLVVASALLVAISHPVAGAERRQQVGPGIGANTKDPKEILRAATGALREIRAARYQARYRGTGAFATRTPTVVGKVSLEKLAPTDPLVARIAVEGVFSPSGSADANGFRVTFDGRQVRKLNTNTKVIVEKDVDTDPNGRTLGGITALFGGGAYHLLLLELVDRSPLAQQSDAAADYEGTTSIEGVLCHVVYLEYRLGDGRIKRERWFISAADRLPRGVEYQAVDDKGRFGSYELILSDVQADPKLVDSEFSMPTPTGYTVRPYESPARVPLLPEGSPAPDFRLLDSDAKPHTLADYRGKLVIIDFWATWCGPCVQAMPGMQRLYDKYRTLGVEILGINVWEESNAAAYMSQKHYTYPLLLKGEKVAEAYQATVLPTVYLIGSDGTILFAGRPTSADSIEALLVRQLRGRQ
jgi:thiol-disulfide isomerase/thioredoxin